MITFRLISKKEKKSSQLINGANQHPQQFKGVDSELPVVKFPTHRLIFRVLFLTL